MQIPRGVATFNKHVNNRVQGLWAGALPPWAMILHVGRRSGTAYRTPVVGFVSGGALHVPLLYGEDSDWAQNVLAGGARVRRARQVHRIGAARIVPRAEIALGGPGGRYVRSAPSALVMPLG